MTPKQLLFNLIIQSVMQSLFLVFYFESQHRKRDFMIFMLVFDVLLFPINQRLTSMGIFIRNFLNMVVLVITGRIVFYKLSWKKILIGILLYEVCLILAEMLAIFPTVSFPSLMADRMDVVYLIANCTLAIIMYLMLWLFSSPFRQVTKAAPAVSCLLLNLISTGLCILESINPLNVKRFEIDYFISLALLVAINGFTLYLLIKTIKSSSHQKAIDEIRKVYQMQVEDYLINQKEEENLRKLRHDLLNFIQSAEDCSIPSVTAHIIKDPNRTEEKTVTFHCGE